MKSLAKVERQLEPQARSQARSRPSLRPQEHEAGPTPAPHPTGAPSDQSGHSFSQISVLPRPALHIQRKLAIGPSSDGYELEADRVAEQVMRMPEPRSAALGLSSSVAALQRECACGGTCDSCKSKDEHNESVRVQMKASGPGSAGGIEAPPIVHEVLRSFGQPLDAATRTFMEPRFGWDFGNVRVHADRRAAESAQAVNASAYTVGRDIVFAEGRFDPGNPLGRRLLAHELTHTIQQSSGAVLQRQPAEIPMPEVWVFALDETKRTDKNYAWAQARKDKARIQKAGKLYVEDKQEIIAKLRFFLGDAKKAYLTTMQPALAPYTDDVLEILRESASPGVGEHGTDKPSCDISKQQFLLEYEGEPGKARCFDRTKDPEFYRDYVDVNIDHAVGYAVEGTTWENIHYSSFKVMHVTYKNKKTEYFMLSEIGDFRYGSAVPVSLEWSYLKRGTGLIYPVYRGNMLLNEKRTPNLVSLKNGLRYQVKEIQDLYTLLQTAGAFASIISTYALVIGFRESLQGFRLQKHRPTTTEPEPPTGGLGKRTDEPNVSTTRTTKQSEPPPVAPGKTTDEPAVTTTAKQQPKPPPKPPAKTEETHTTVARTDDDPTGFKGGKKKAPTKKGGKQQQEDPSSKAASKKGDDDPEDPKGGKRQQTTGESKTPTAPAVNPDDPQAGVKAAIDRAKQRVTDSRTEINKYNDLIQKAREKGASEDQLQELKEQRDVPIRQLQKDQAKIATLQAALDKKTYDRPGFREGMREEVWQNAVKDAQEKFRRGEGDGLVRSPSGTEIKPGDPWVMGHQPKYEFWKHQRSAAERGITRTQFIEEYNKANHYRPETESDNRSHAYEDKTDAYLGD